MRPKYWKGVFANCVESELIEGDLAGQFDGEIPKGAVVPRAYVRIQRSGLRGVAERTRLTILQLLAEVPASYWPDELWNQPEAGYIVFAWETPDTSQLPVGFAAFTVHIMDDAEGVVSTKRPFENVLFSYDLVFVRPAKRGVGFGKYLSEGIREWIGRCRVIWT